MQGARAIADKERAERHSEPSLPEHMVVNNKKDQLHNDVLCFLNCHLLRVFETPLCVLEVRSSDNLTKQ